MATATYTKYRKRKYKEPGLLVSIELDPDNIVYLSDQYRTVTNEYEGLLKGISGLHERLPIGGRFQKRGDARLKIYNKKLNFQADATSRFSDLLADYGLIGAKVIIKQWFNGCALTDCETIYQGWVKLPVKYNEQMVDLIVSPLREENLIAPDVLSVSDYSNLDASLQGSAFPVIYGQVTHYSTDGDSLDLTVDGGAICLSTEIDNSNHYWLVAGHKISAVDHVYDETTDQIGSTNVTTSGVAGGPAWRTTGRGLRPG